MDLGALNELAGYVAPGIPQVADLVRHAATAPHIYRTELPDHADRTEDDRSLPRVAFEEALASHGRLARIDWRADPEEVLAAFDSLVEAVRPGLHCWTDEERDEWAGPDSVDLDDASADRVVAFAAERLQRHGLRCLNLGGGTDTFAVALVPDAVFERSVACARRAGFSEVIDLADGA